jgi:FkbM family methyltransferase
VTFVSYAQNFEDVLLWRALREVKHGFYIDIGAAHPDIDSVTRAFYDRGWSGINIEPTREFSVRLVAARPRDLNLQIAIAAEAGEAELFVADGTGLSTLDPDGVVAITRTGIAVHRGPVKVETLAEICRRHASPVIHFMKIDVEGTEQAVLAGADFRAFRPWIVLVEATTPMSTEPSYARWEPLLLEASYRFVWFDGLNRFYVANEKLATLSESFRAPPNVFDDFIRAADSEWARRIQQAETRAADLLERATAAEARLAGEALATGQARAQLSHRTQEVLQLRELMQTEVRAREAAEAKAVAQAARADRDSERALIHERRQRDAVAAYEAIRASTSWRVTAPLRRLRSRATANGPELSVAPALPSAPATGYIPDVTLPTRLSPLPPRKPQELQGQNRRVVHQFHSGSAVGDAITNAMLMTRSYLRNLGYTSDIFVEHRDPALRHDLRLAEELPAHDRYVLIVGHSLGFDAFTQVAALAAPKVLLYHSITPPELLAGNETTQRYAVLGRAQLVLWRDRVAASLAVSEYNAIELRNLGFDPVQVCKLLFDVDTLLMRAAATMSPARNIFTILFVGRVVPSKGQSDLVEAFAAFRRGFGKPSRLVIIGRHGGAEDSYMREIQSRIAAHNLHGQVLLPGLVSDDALHEWYAAADIYLSMSWHEGFGVPLVEAMAHGVPVLARAVSGVPYTMYGTGGLLHDETPEAVGGRLLAIAKDDVLRRSMLDAQRVVLQQFALDRQKPALIQALAAAGASPPITRETREILASCMRFTITGHVKGSYSLAAINRTLALALEAERPGDARLLPVEGEAATMLAGIAASDVPEIKTLIARPKFGTSPEIVISQHYPVYIPPDGGDLLLAFFFWEESIVPRETISILNQNFRGVLVSTSFVAKALIDSGLTIPLRVVGFAPRLEGYKSIAAERKHMPRHDRPFTFLHVSSAFPRKGVDLLLRAYLRAFGAQDDVRLIIKTFPNPHNDVAQQIATLQAQNAEMPAITLLDRDMDEDELLALHRDADVAVLPTRGEGFNLPAAEAVAAGLPLIVTGYGGHIDFCSSETARLIDFGFAASCSHLSSAGSVWVEPDVDDLTAALLSAKRAPPALMQPLAVANTATFVRKITEAAVDLLVTPPQPALRIGWVSSWDVRCGIAEYSRHLIDVLPRSSATETITLFSDRRTLSQAHPDERVKVLPCWELGLPSGLRPLVRAVSVEDPQVLVIQHQPGLIAWPDLAELLVCAALRTRIVVVVLHSTIPLENLPDRERADIIRALTSAARVLVHTVDDLNRLKTFGLLRNVTLLPHGAQVATELAPIPRALTRSSFPVVGSYGFFLPDKGIPQLIAAFVLLRHRYPSIRLRLVNAEYGIPESAAEIARCRELAEAAGITDAIEWYTDFLPHEKSLDLLRSCDVIALPYQMSKEASSASLRTALGAGQPVAVTPIALFKEAEAAAFRFRGLQGPDLAEGLAELLGRPERRAELQSNARQWLQQRAWPLVAARMHDMLVGLHVQSCIQTAS